MINILINDIIKNRLLKYAEADLHQGHWGDAEVTIPEHQNLAIMIGNSGKSIELSLLEAGILIQWIEDATKGGRIITQEDLAVIDNVRTAIEKYKKTLTPHTSFAQEIEEADLMLKTLAKIWSKPDRPHKRK